MNSTLCKFFIVRVLSEAPVHGYEIIQKVAQMTDNFCVPTGDTVYPVLREFEE